jgi:hypothetical protein
MSDTPAAGRARDDAPGPALAGLAGVGLLAAATWPMQKQSLPALAAAALAAGLLMWAWLAVRFPPPPDALGEIDPGPAPVRRALLVASIACAAGAWFFTAGGTYRTPGVVLWIAASVGWVAAWTRRGLGGPAVPSSLRPWQAGVILAVILLAAVFFSFHHLAHTPSNPTSDHAETLLDVQDILKGERPIYFPRNTGREPFKFYWLWFLVSVVGLPTNYLTLKIATAAIGLLAIPAMYLLGREMGGARLGLFAAALVSFAKWHVAMARLGLRVTHAVFPTAMVLWALLRYLRRRDRNSAVWAGVWIGIGLYGYTPFRVVPLLVPLALLLAMGDPRRRGGVRSLVATGLLITATAVIVFLPLFHYMVENPATFWYRAASRTSSAEHAVGPRPIAVFARNVANMALSLHWRGTETVVNAVGNDPFLDPVTGALVLAGLVLVASLIVRGSRRWALLAISFVLLTLPSTLSLAFPQENPSINRSVTAIPAVFLVAALALSEIARRASLGGRGVRVAAGAGIVALLAVAAWQNYVRYFVDFNRTYPYNVHPSLEVSRAIADYRTRGVPLRQVYLMSVPNWVDARNVAFELGDPDWVQNNVAPEATPPELVNRPLLFVFKRDDELRRSSLRAMYPAGEERIYELPTPGRDFGVYYVP